MKGLRPRGRFSQKNSMLFAIKVGITMKKMHSFPFAQASRLPFQYKTDGGLSVLQDSLPKYNIEPLTESFGIIAHFCPAVLCIILNCLFNLSIFIYFCIWKEDSIFQLGPLSSKIHWWKDNRTNKIQPSKLLSITIRYYYKYVKRWNYIKCRLVF